MKKQHRVVVAYEADSHAGNKLGLCDPDTMIITSDRVDEPAPVALNAYQEDLWHRRLEWIVQAKQFAGRDDLIHVHNGDLTDGRKYPTMKLTSSLAGQAAIACKNLLPWYKVGKVKASVVITGTASHAWEDASAETMVVEMLSAAGYPVELLHHALLDLQGMGKETLMDVAHHGPSIGIREWTKGNQLRYYLRSNMIGEALNGNTIPILYTRAHFHTFWKEQVGIDTQREGTIILLPSLCGMGEYGRMATGSSPHLTNGVVLVEVIDGELGRIVPLLKRRDVRQRKKI